MKREIIFRGKRKDNGEWVYGDLLHSASGEVKINAHKKGQPWLGYCVDGETVGQYTGLTDKYGKKIFEGDIMRKYDNRDNEMIGVVQYSDGAFGVKFVNGFSGQFLCFCKNSVVIGNIHDNSELLGGE